MGVLPKINFMEVGDLEKTQKTNKKTGKTFLIDFSKGKMLRQNGKLIKTDDERAIRMWLEKVLLTEKHKYQIYKNYGMEYKENIQGNRFPTPILYSEFIRELHETVAKNHKILEIKNIDVKLIRNTLNTKFTVVLSNFQEFEWEANL